MNIVQFICLCYILFPNFIIINNTVMNILARLSGKCVGMFTGHICVCVCVCVCVYIYTDTHICIYTQVYIDILEELLVYTRLIFSK